MIQERAMWRGKRVDNDELVTGYIICKDSHVVMIFNPQDVDDERTQWDTYPVDPATIEPVAVAPIPRDGFYRCPNCDETVLISKYNYCPHCGQRILWEGENINVS